VLQAQRLRGYAAHILSITDPERAYISWVYFIVVIALDFGYLTARLGWKKQMV
jgi:hypothetical protein